MSLLRLVTLSFSSLRNLDIGANKFYDRVRKLYDAALLNRCYTQHALWPYKDTKINHIRHFIKIQFVNRAMKIINLLVHLKINLLSLLFLLILKIGNPLSFVISIIKVSKGAKIRNRYNLVPHLTQDTNGKVTNSQ